MNSKSLVLALTMLLIFQILILLVPITAADSVQFEIVNVVTRKEDGTPSTTFRKGEFVFVEVTVRRTDGEYYYYYVEKSFLIIVRATTGSPPVMWGLGAFKGSLAVGEEMTAAPAFQIPEDAPTGTMQITVYVWSDWAVYGGYPLATPYVTYITVTD